MYLQYMHRGRCRRSAMPHNFVSLISAQQLQIVKLKITRFLFWEVMKYPDEKKSACLKRLLVASAKYLGSHNLHKERSRGCCG